MFAGPSRALRGQLPGLEGRGSTAKVRNNAHRGDPRRGAQTSSSEYFPKSIPWCGRLFSILQNILYLQQNNLKSKSLRYIVGDYFWLNVCVSSCVLSVQDKHYLCVLASDSPGQNLSQFFPLCNDFIHAARLRGGNVLIHWYIRSKYTHHASYSSLFFFYTHTHKSISSSL